MENPSRLASLHWNEQLQCTEIIDQTLLPHELRWCALQSLPEYCRAISTMQVRGAPLIGITAAFGLAQALQQEPSDPAMAEAEQRLLATRPTAVNLRWALEQVRRAVEPLAPRERARQALATARELRAADIANCSRIGEHGLTLLRQLPVAGRLNILTHCNAGWLATVQWGTALAPVYKAQEAGLDVHVWVSETRPRNQGSFLTAWELQQAGVPCTVVADNACGLLLQRGEVDCVIVGSDRTAANGDVCNKVGTYLKALAARAHGVPFYVALPESTIDWHCASGAEIPIEEREQREVLALVGRDAGGVMAELALAGRDTLAANPAFDVTPAELVDGLITEHGVYPASAEGLAQLRRDQG